MSVAVATRAGVANRVAARAASRSGGEGPDACYAGWGFADISARQKLTIHTPNGVSFVSSMAMNSKAVKAILGLIADADSARVG